MINEIGLVIAIVFLVWGFTLAWDLIVIEEIDENICDVPQIIYVLLTMRFIVFIPAIILVVTQYDGDEQIFQWIIFLLTTNFVFW